MRNLEKLDQGLTDMSVTRRGFLGRGLGAAVMLSGMGALVDACSSSTTGSTTGSIAKTVTCGQVGDFTSFDPWFNQAFNRFMHYQVFNPVVFLDPSDGKYKPLLATSWTYASDGSKLTLNLRKGVKFHNGREMTAADIVKNIQRAQDTSIGHTLASAASVIAAANATSDYVVDVTYKTPRPEDVALDLFASMFVIAPEAFATVAKAPVGTGPYTLAGFQPGVSTTFSRFPGYWKTAAKTATIVVKPFSDSSAMVLNLQSGGVDIIANPPYNQLKSLNGGSTKVVGFDVLGAFWCVAINSTAPTLSNKVVRQALAYAVNRDKIVQDVFFGGAQATSTPFYYKTTTVYKAADLTRYAYDLNKAKQLLSQAGVANLSFVINSEPPLESTSVAQVIQNDFKSIGVNTTINQLQSSVGDPAWLQGNFQLYANATAILPRDLSATFTAVAVYRNDAKNNCHWTDPTYQQLASQAASTLDSSKRLQLYGQLRDQIVEDMWCLPVASRPIHYALGSKVSGIQDSIGDYVILEQVAKAS
jgi:peptide/nickel transport system substrate-binding protein